MKILITGSKGQLGKKLADVLSSKNELFLTDSNSMNITDIDLVRKIIKEKNPDWIIHGAAYTKVDKAEEEVDLCRKINSIGTKNIAIVAKEFDVKLIYISTDYVFDGAKNTPYTETDNPNPISVYGLTKYEGEKFVQEICDKYYILRVSWLFGDLPESYAGTNFVETMLKLSKERTELNIVNDQIGSPTYTLDLANVISKIIEKNPEFGVYNFSGNVACSWYDFAKEIFKKTNTAIKLNPITSAQYQQKAKRPIYSYLDKSKIERTLNLKVRFWQEMLAQYLKNR